MIVINSIAVHAKYLLDWPCLESCLILCFDACKFNPGSLHSKVCKKVQADPVGAVGSASFREFVVLIPGSGTFFHYLLVTGERMSS